MYLHMFLVDLQDLAKIIILFMFTFLLLKMRLAVIKYQVCKLVLEVDRLFLIILFLSVEHTLVIKSSIQEEYFTCPENLSTILYLAEDTCIKQIRKSVILVCLVFVIFCYWITN